MSSHESARPWTAAATVYHNIGGILYARGDFATAEGPARKARKISCQLLGEDAPRTMLDATAYAGILERAYGPEHHEVAATLHNLAAVQAVLCQPEAAENHYRRALTIKEKLLDAENPDVALTRNNLGKLLTDLGRPAEAVPLLEAAVAVFAKRLPASHPHLATTRENLRNAIGPGNDMSRPLKPSIPFEPVRPSLSLH